MVMKNLKLAGFGFFEKTTGLLADAAYGILDVTFENDRFITAKNVEDLYFDTKAFLSLYNAQDANSLESDGLDDAFHSAESIATLVTQFAKYSISFANKPIDNRLVALANKPSKQYAFELTGPDTSRAAYEELTDCLDTVGYVFGMKKE